MVASLYLLLLAAARPHPESLSRSQVLVVGNAATVELRFQSLSLIEVLPELDSQPDGRLDADELAAGRSAVEAYLLANFRLQRVEGEREEPLSGSVQELETEQAREGPLDLQWLRARLSFSAGTELEVLVVESHLFHETNPWHQDNCTVAWNGAEEVPHLFQADETRWRFEPAHVRRPKVFTAFLELGAKHVLLGFDHLAFLLVLLVASRRVRTLLGVVTAFALAHSLTLAVAAPGWVDLPFRFVDLAFALAIAYVATENLVRRDPRSPWLEATFFGLLHGLGFRGFLAQDLAGEYLVITALASFDLGLWLGQLAVVLPAVLLLRILFLVQAAQREPGQIAPRWFRLSASAVVAVFGFYWFTQRAGWVP